MSSALNNLADALSQFSDRTPLYTPDRCVNVLHQRFGQCDACRAICPVDAITLEPGPRISQVTCLACDACTAACPSAALTGRRDPLTLWREAARRAYEREDGAAVIYCRALGAGQFEATRVPCLSALPPEFFIALRLAGVENLTCHTADCAACPLGETLPQAEQAIDEAWTVLDALRLDLAITVETEPPQAADPDAATISRRGFFTLFRSSNKPLADSLAELTGADVGWRRALLLNGLMRVALSEAATVPTTPGCWGGVAADDAKCIGCQMCMQFCPTGALALDQPEEGGELSLLFCAARCTACGLCVRACFKHALTLTPDVSLAEIASGDYLPIWQGAPQVNPLSKLKPPFFSAQALPKP